MVRLLTTSSNWTIFSHLSVGQLHRLSCASVRMGRTRRTMKVQNSFSFFFGLSFSVFPPPPRCYFCYFSFFWWLISELRELVFRGFRCHLSVLVRSVPDRVFPTETRGPLSARQSCFLKHMRGPGHQQGGPAWRLIRICRRGRLGNMQLRGNTLQGTCAYAGPV